MFVNADSRFKKKKILNCIIHILNKRVVSIHRLGEDLASIWTGPQHHLCVNKCVCLYLSKGCLLFLSSMFN